MPPKQICPDVRHKSGYGLELLTIPAIALLVVITFACTCGQAHAADGWSDADRDALRIPIAERCEARYLIQAQLFSEGAARSSEMRVRMEGLVLAARRCHDPHTFEGKQVEAILDAELTRRAIALR